MPSWFSFKNPLVPIVTQVTGLLRARNARRSTFEARSSHSSASVITCSGSLPRCKEIPPAIKSISSNSNTSSLMCNFSFCAGFGCITVETLLARKIHQKFFELYRSIAVQRVEARFQASSPAANAAPPRRVCETMRAERSRGARRRRAAVSCDHAARGTVSRRSRARRGPRSTVLPSYSSASERPARRPTRAPISRYARARAPRLVPSSALTPPRSRRPSG